MSNYLTTDNRSEGRFAIEKFNDRITMDYDEVLIIMEAMLKFIRKEIERTVND